MSYHPRSVPRLVILLAGGLSVVGGASEGPSHAAQFVVVVLDDSGSMDERMRSDRGTRKMDAAKEALVQVLEKLPSDAEVGIVLLNGRRRGDPWIVPLGPVQINQARQAIRGAEADGGTPLGEFMKIGADALLQARARAHYGEFRLLVVTDGENTQGLPPEYFLPDIMSRGLTVDVIGVDLRDDHSLATQVHTYRRADDPASLRQAVQQVFAETSADDDSTSRDFERLEGLPVDVAAAALAALADVGNQPIQAVDPDQPSGNGWMPGPGQPGAPRSWWPALIVLLIILWSVSAVKKASRRRGHR